MFEKLSDRIQGAVKALKGQGRISEKNIHDSLRAVRIALLEADVNVSVVRDLLRGVKEKALGEKVLSSLSPDQHFIKILNEEMVRVLGEGDAGLSFSPTPPGIIMLVGLQGSGKTTTAGKLARHFSRDGHPCLLVPADVYRPAARAQLERVGKAVETPVFQPEAGDSPVAICGKAVLEARRKGVHRVVVDTAGRLAIDEHLMEELAEIAEKVKPDEILYVADAMVGQSALDTVKAFHEKVRLTGVIMAKADGDARGGAILSVKAATGLPVKFVGVGEKYDALEAFKAERMASRILGMGDVLGLIEKAEEAVGAKDAEEMERRLRKKDFTLDDFRTQLRHMKKLGPLEQVLGMIPGVGGALRGIDTSRIDDRKLVRVEAILNSMTSYERNHYKVINGSRRRRIAMGSGTAVSEVNRVIKEYLTMRKMMSQFKKKGMKGMTDMLRNIGR